MARMKTKRFYTADNCSDFIHGQYKDTRWPVQFTLLLDEHFVGISKQGLPWECLLVKGAQAAAEADPNLFQHPVLYGYAEGNLLYLMTQKSQRARQLHQFVRYEHNFTKALRKFDTFSKTEFLRHFGQQGVEIKLKPPRAEKRSGERRTPASPRVRRPPGQKIYRGAYRRARDAGLVPPAATPV